jgi:site-specific DNA-methyltransferase (adenine-specific)
MSLEDSTKSNKKYQIILADPPWDYNDKGCQGTMANHYSGMKIKDICSLPISEIAGKNCILFLWTTYPMLKEALTVIDAWGFTYKTIAFQWLKLNPSTLGFFYGLGRWTRGNTEPCLLATKGKPKRISPNVFQIIDRPRMKHSKKPHEARKRIIELVGDLPRIELFARQKTEGWDVWGNEVESDIDLYENA